MKVIRNLFKTVTCDHRSRRFFGDEILHAEPVPKLLLMPTTWRGDLQPVLDAYLAQLAPLTNGLTLGNVLHAEEIPHVLNLGRAWLGDFADRMKASRSDAAGALDATPVLDALEAARRTMGTGAPVAVADGLRNLRRAADRVARRDEHGAFSEGKRIADGLMRRHHVGDFSKPVSTATINQRNHDFHAVTPQLDSSGRMNWRTGDAAAPEDRTAVRDAVHAANHAATPRARLAAMNGAAKAFWSSGEPPSLTADMLRTVAPTGTASSIASINARNKSFWATR